MKTVEVIESFFDKVIKDARNVGDVFEVDAERFAVLAGDNDYERAFVKEVEDASTDKDESTDEGEQGPADDIPVDYSKLNTTDLKALLTEKGITFDKKANKPDLITLLTGAE